MLERARPANDVTSESRDAYVDKAIRAIKAEPARRWTVASLARVAGLSRAPFARRFRAATGRTPLRFLREHRVGLAKARLVEGDGTLAAIAAEVGYADEFALTKAFTRVVGIAPGRYRRRVIALRGAWGAITAVRAAA
jgi:AraC-like DNA-binding protein